MTPHQALCCWDKFPDTSTKYISWYNPAQKWRVTVAGYKTRWFSDLAQAIQYRDQTPPKNTATNILSMKELRN